MYHRIAEVPIDPWRLSVIPERFDQQLAYLCDELEPVPLAEICQPSLSGNPKVAITFDDGYRDNFEYAFPLLEKHGIPATFFVVSSTVGQNREFWWDELEHIVLSTHPLPQSISLEGPCGTFHRQLGSASRYSEEQQREDREIEVFQAATGTRLHLFRELWDYLCVLSHAERQQKLDDLWAWSGRARVDRNSYRPMTQPEIKTLAESPLIEIGAHTMTHPRLPSLSGHRKKEEILEGVKQLTALMGKEPTSFSFPFGQWDPESLDIVENSFDCAVVTRPATVISSTPRHRLNRFAVENWDREEFHSRIRAWCDESN